MAPPSEVARRNAHTAFFVLRHCPFCSGLGHEDDEECRRCDGSGDLLGALLLRAYDAGVQDASGRLAWIIEQFEGIIRQTEEIALADLDTSSVKRRVREVRSRAGAAHYGEDNPT